MTVLALVAARGGSKGIPRKNIRQIAGKPLIAWTIEAALAAGKVDRVVVSTDDAEIAAVAKSAGADVPFMRPEELAGDNASGIAPVLHAIEMLPEFNAVLLLQPTSPLRNSSDIDAMIGLAFQKNANSVVSMCEVEDHPYWTYAIGEGGLLHRPDGLPDAPRRQDLPARYVLNGAMYYAKAEWLRQSHRLVSEETLGYVMPPERSIDIDGLFDWRVAEIMLSNPTTLEVP